MEEASTDTMGWLAPATVGLGAALLAGGGVFGWLSSQSVEDRNALVGKSWDDDIDCSDYQKHDDTAGRRALMANVLLGAGAVAAVSGVVMWWTASGGAEGTAAQRLRVVPAPAGAVVVWSEVLPRSSRLRSYFC